MKFLILCLCAALPLWAADDIDTWCEHRLIAVKQAPMFFASFRRVIEGGAAEFPARVSRTATAIGARRYGVDDTKSPLTLSLKTSDVNRDNIVIVLTANEKIVYKALIKLPPLYVWTRFEGGGDLGPVAFPRSYQEWQGYRIGLVLESNFQSRKFAEIKRDQRGQMKIVLGLDVDCALARNYGSTSRRYVMFNEKYYLCRVPLIEAPL